MPQISARFVEFLDQTALPADSIRAAAALGITALKVALAEQPGLATDLARAFVDDALVRFLRPENAEAYIEQCDAAAELFSDAPHPRVRLQAYRARYYKAHRMRSLKRGEEALDVQRALIADIDNASDSLLFSIQANALAAVSGILEDSGQRAAANTVLDDIVTRFEAADDPDLMLSCASARHNRAEAHARAGDKAGAAAEFAVIVTRYGDAVTAALKDRVAMALWRQSELALSVDDYATARGHFEAILHRFQNDGEQSLKTMVKDATKKLKALAAA